MTLEFSISDYGVLDAALDNRMERIREMIDLFAEREEWNYVEVYNNELENAKTIKYRLNQIFHSEF